MDRLFKTGDIVYIKGDDKKQMYEILDKSIIDGEYAYNLEPYNVVLTDINEQPHVDEPMFAREIELASEEDKLRTVFGKDIWDSEVDPALETEYTIDKDNIIVGVQLSESTDTIDSIFCSFVKVADEQDTYKLEVNDGVSSEIYITIEGDDVEHELKDKLYLLGCVYPFELGMVNNIGKFFKPFKNEYIPNIDVLVNLLDYLHRQEVITFNSSYDDVERALRRYNDIII